MELNQETIIGFLTGSLATVILKGIIDGFNKRIEFRRELKKKLYDKKIDAAENTVKALVKSMESALILANTIDTALENEMDEEIFINIWETYFNLMGESETALLNSSAYLYFQLQDAEFWSNEDQRLFIETISKVKVIGTDTNGKVRNHSTWRIKRPYGVTS